MNYRFKKQGNLSPCNNLGKNIQFSAALSFFKVDCIPENLLFDEHLKPTFEDGKFVNSYLLSQSNDSFIYFNPNARYYNRKRADKSSTMDGVWLHKGQFSTVFERGYLDILPKCQAEKGYIPKYLQRTILWEMLRLVKYLLNHEEKVYFLSIEEKQNLLELMDKTFKYIDKETIMNYELGNCGFSRQLGMLGCFKMQDVDKQVVYIDKIDFHHHQFQARFFSCFDVDFEIIADGKELLPSHYKKSNRFFLNRVFLTEHLLWLPIPTNDSTIKIYINGQSSFITYKGVKYKQGLPAYELEKKIPNMKKEFWTFIDRDDQAGDNAEFLYEFVKNNIKNQKIAFVLNKNSNDWKRLNNKGFNLVAHGSNAHLQLLNNSSLLLSSQIGSIIEPFDKIDASYKRVFLQHGVIKDDLSQWLNNVKMDLMLTSTKEENKSIVDNHSKYIYGKKEIALTGLPRFDSLFENRNNFKNQIMLMFTWRKSITGTFKSNNKSEREINHNFKETMYFKRLNDFFHNTELKEIANKYNTQFIFSPHPNMKPYLKFFDLPNYIQPISDNELMHNVINNSAMVITDFSSIAFDFAYQNKPVCYYQFDKEEFFNGTHTYSLGYYDYDRDGFGPVFTQLNDVIGFTETIVQNNFSNPEPYAHRVKSTFLNIEQNNCARVYEAIKEISNEKITLENTPSETQLSLLAAQSYDAKNWNTSRNRYNYLTSISNSPLFQLRYLESLIHVGQINDVLAYKDKLTCDFPITLQGLLSFYCYDFQAAYEFWSKDINKLAEFNLLAYSLCLFKLNKHNEYKQLINEVDLESEIFVVRYLIQFIFNNMTNSKYFDLELLDTIAQKITPKQKKNFLWDLIVAEIFYEKNNLNKAFFHLQNFETYSNNPIRRFLIAFIVSEKNNWLKVIQQIEALEIPARYHSRNTIDLYLTAMNKTENYEKIKHLLLQLGDCND